MALDNRRAWCLSVPATAGSMGHFKLPDGPLLVEQVAHKFGSPEDAATLEGIRQYLSTSLVFRAVRTDDLYLIQFVSSTEHELGLLLGSVVRELHNKALERSAASGTPAEGAVGGRSLLIDPAAAFLKYPSGFLAYPIRWHPDLADDPAIFVKDTRLASFGDKDDWEEWQRFFKSELTVLEMLRHRPHPNIATYLGCAVRDVCNEGSDTEDLRIVGIVMEHYPLVLRDRCQPDQPPLKATRCVEQIHAALMHLHGLGYCHNDVNPDNVMLKADGTAVLIDFDSCLPINAPLQKGTTRAWSNEAADKKSNPANDWWGLDLVKKHLLEAADKQASSRGWQVVAEHAPGLTPQSSVS